MPPIDVLMRKYQRELTQILSSPAFRQLVTLAVVSLIIAFLVDRLSRRNQPVRTNTTNSSTPNQSTTVGRLISSITQTPNQSNQLLTPSQKYFTKQPASQRRTVIITSDCLPFDDQHSINQSVKQTLQHLASACRVIILHQCNEDDDDSEVQLIDDLAHNQLIGSEAEGRIPPHRVVTCTTSKGAIAIVRQVEPTLLIGTSAEYINSLKPFVLDCLIIDANTKINKFNPPLLYPINTINGLTKFSITSSSYAQRPIVTCASIDQWFNGVKAQDEHASSQTTNQSANKQSANQAASLSDSLSSSLNAQ